MSQINTGTDAITEEVVRMGIRQITHEMGATVKRISGSTIITEADDFTAMVYGPKGELLDAPFGPIYAGSGGQCMRKFLARFGEEGFAEGEVFLANDPYSTGALHANDMQVITPVMLDGRCVGFTYMHAHVMDVGGIVPGSWGVGAKDVFAEAFRLPFVRYMRGGKVDESIRAIIARNTRLPELVLNDIHGLVTATRQGAAQLSQLVARYGADEFARLTDAILSRTEAAARARLATLTPDTFEEVDWIEHNGQVDELYAVRGRLTAGPQGLDFAFTGSPQTDGFINATASDTAGMVDAAVVGMLFYDLPFNEGMLRTISLSAQPGTVVCAIEPAPVSSGHIEGGMKIHTVAVRLLGRAMRGSTDEAVRRRAHAPFAASVTMATMAGLDRNGAYTVFADMSGMGSGGGAGPTNDGLDVSAPQQASSIRMPDIESMEEAYPLLFLWRRVRTDSGGPGRRRGGTGLDAAWIPHGTQGLSGVVNSACGHVPVLGAAGGFPGAGTRCELIDGMDVRGDWFERGVMPRREDAGEGEALASKAAGVSIRPDQVWRMRLPGGGGFGDPAEREPAAVVRDVRIGAVSVRQAADAYGVALDDSAEGFDAARTATLRADLRDRRRKAARPGSNRTSAGDCGGCGAHHEGDEWLTTSGSLSAELGALGVEAEPYDDLTLEQVICPSCGTLHEIAHSAGPVAPVFPAEGGLEKIL